MEIKEPNFLVIGAGKCGTTSLYEYLKDHPQVFMSPIKETNFFALEGENLDSGDDPEQIRHYPWSVTDKQEYQDLFRNVEKERAIGEVSPMYLYSNKAAVGIKNRLPQAKLIVILRQPVDRLYSRFLHLARENRTPTPNFADALDKESIWWRRNDLVQEGFYYSHLEKYFNLFPSNQIKVILYDDFRMHPQKVMMDIYQFIGVDPNHVPNLNTEFNVSGIVVNQNIDRIIGQNSVVKKWIGTSFPKLSNYLTNSRVVKSWVNQLRNKNLNRPLLSKELKVQISQIYSTEIDRLQSLINRDISHWHYN